MAMMAIAACERQPAGQGGDGAEDPALAAIQAGQGAIVADPAIAGVPSCRLRCGLECAREHVGLPVPCIAVRAGWYTPQRPGHRGADATELMGLLVHLTRSRRQDVGSAIRRV
jgi:hypothetical protein